jgi:hypothetical protein
MISREFTGVGFFTSIKDENVTSCRNPEADGHPRIGNVYDLRDNKDELALVLCHFFFWEDEFVIEAVTMLKEWPQDLKPRDLVRSD